MEDDKDSALLRGRFNLNLFAAFIAASTVTIFVMVYMLRTRCLRRRQAYLRRQALLGRLPSLGLTITTSGDSPLDPMVINSLPIFRFKQTNQFSETYDPIDKSTECSVCLIVLKDEEMVRILPNCTHMFHAECIDKWLGLHSTCPLCRIEAMPRVKPEPREGPFMAI